MTSVLFSFWHIYFKAKDLKEECGDLMSQTEDFQKMADQFIALTEQVLDLNWWEFLSCKNL